DQRPLPTGPRHEARPDVERHQLTPDARLHLRLVEQKRRALAKTRDAAERKLESVESELDRCSPMRRRRRERLRADREGYGNAIGLMDGRLADASGPVEDVKLQNRTLDRSSEGLARHAPDGIPRGAHAREPRALRLER